jgi:type I restriction enzyme M protein
LAAALRALDERHNAALWAHVREAFDYPVFVAAPKAVGISSTGETGENVPNDLPNVLAGYRRFKQWLAAGAAASKEPSFAA